jgi:hypothetical protein
MSDRASALADQFEQASAGFISMLEGLSDDQWQNQLDGEGWPVGVGACHVAEHYANITELVTVAADSKPMPDWAPKSLGDLDKLNAEIAARNTNRPRAETMAMLRTNGEKAAEQLRKLSDEQLERKVLLPAVGAEWSAEQITQLMLIGHIGMHSPSIQKAAGT